MELLGRSIVAILGSLLFGLGLLIAAMNVVSVVRNHSDRRSRSSHVFLAAGMVLFCSLLMLRALYTDRRLALAMFGLIVLAEAVPLSVAAALQRSVQRRAERLDGADLEAQNLEGRNLRGARLRAANLRRANLRQADLRDADLTEADMSGADLTGAALDGATLDGARFQGADLSGTEIHRVLGYEKARFSHETKWPVEMDRSAIPR